MVLVVDCASEKGHCSRHTTPNWKARVGGMDRHVPGMMMVAVQQDERIAAVDMLRCGDVSS